MVDEVGLDLGGVGRRDKHDDGAREAVMQQQAAVGCRLGQSQHLARQLLCDVAPEVMQGLLRSDGIALC